MYDFEYIMSEKARIDILDLLKVKADINQLKNLTRSLIPDSLYKYSSVNEYTVNNLKRNELTLISPSEFNDIYDSTMHFDSHSEHHRRIIELNKLGKQVGLNEVSSKETEVIILKNSLKEDEHKLTNLTKNFRIACFSTDPKDIKMWSHYADKNKGICINYYSKGMGKISDNIYPVLYIDKPIDVTEVCKDSSKVITAALCSVISKFKDWEHEKEWRIIFIWLPTEEKRIQFPNIPHPKCIFLGNRFLENYRQVKKYNPAEFKIIEEFLEYVKQSKINLKFTKPQIRSYCLDFEDIDVDEIKRKS